MLRCLMVCASCQAITRLMATASTSSRTPSSTNRLSNVEPLWRSVLILALVMRDSACTCSCWSGEGDIGGGRRARLLQNSVQYDQTLPPVDIPLLDTPYARCVR